MDRARIFTAPLDGAREGALELRPGGTHVTVRAAAIDGLLRAGFDGAVPQAHAAGGRVTIEYPRLSLTPLLRHRGQRAEIQLNATLPWALVVRRGVADSSLDLSGLQLVALQFSGGIKDVGIVLPRPRGIVRVRVAGGASKLTLVRPDGVAAVLALGGGASRLTFDNERYGAIGGDTRLETPDAGSRPDRYEIVITGGASRLVVAEQDGTAG
jgi:hypothetical protein